MGCSPWEVTTSYLGSLLPVCGFPRPLQENLGFNFNVSRYAELP